jgi:carotenoid cleavage dioxygenase
MTTISDAHTTVANPYLEGNFAPVTDEHTITELEVDGTIPDGLEGRLLRIGPNPVDPIDPSTYHWFTGTGMVHGLRLSGGRPLWYRNRLVRSDRVTEARGWPETSGPRHGVGDNTANTNVIGLAGRTYAIVEAGSLPMELTDELDTVARSDLGGTLQGGFTAHPKRDPSTGELHAATYYWEWDHVKYVVVGADGRVRRTVEIPVADGPMIHDCAITESNFLVFDLPVTFDLESAMKGEGFPYFWNPDHGARVGVLPREGEAADIRWCEVDQCYVYHPLNAFDLDDGRVVVDVVRHPSTFATSRIGPVDGATRLERWTLDPATGRSTSEVLSDASQEFPRHDERLVGRRHRYGYAAEFEFVGAPQPHMGALVKTDVDRRTTERHDFGPSVHAQEPVFVPRTDHSDEDDGWVMAYVHDDERDAADVVILAAQDFTGDPVATIHLPVRVPYGFHGNWVPDPT